MVCLTLKWQIGNHGNHPFGYCRKVIDLKNAKALIGNQNVL